MLWKCSVFFFLSSFFHLFRLCVGFRSIIATYAFMDFRHLASFFAYVSDWVSEWMTLNVSFPQHSSFFKRVCSEQTRTQFHYTPTIPSCGWLVGFCYLVWTIDEKFKIFKFREGKKNDFPLSKISSLIKLISYINVWRVGAWYLILNAQHPTLRVNKNLFHPKIHGISFS